MLHLNVLSVYLIKILKDDIDKYLIKLHTSSKTDINTVLYNPQSIDWFCKILVIATYHLSD